MLLRKYGVKQMKRGWHRTVASPACLCHPNTPNTVRSRAPTGRALTQSTTEIWDMWTQREKKKQVPGICAVRICLKMIMRRCDEVNGCGYRFQALLDYSPRIHFIYVENVQHHKWHEITGLKPRFSFFYKMKIWIWTTQIGWTRRGRWWPTEGAMELRLADSASIKHFESLIQSCREVKKGREMS